MTFPIPITLGGGIDIGLTTPVQINLGQINLGPIEIKPIEIKPLAINLGPIEVRPIDFTLRIREIPSVRVRLPMDYKVCVNLLGHELASVRLCGQGQVITEPYLPNPCECRPARIRADAVPVRDDRDPAPVA